MVKKKTASKESVIYKMKESAFIQTIFQYKKTMAAVGLDLLNMALIILLMYVISTTMATPLMNQSMWLANKGTDVKAYIESDAAFSAEQSAIVEAFTTGASLFIIELAAIVLLFIFLTLILTAAIQAYIWSIIKEIKFTKKLYLKTLWVVLVLHLFFIPVAGIFFLGNNLFFTIFVLGAYFIFMAWCNNVIFSIMTEDKEILETIGEGIGLSIKKLWNYLPSVILVIAPALLLGALVGSALQSVIEPYISIYIVLLVFLSWSKVMFYIITKRLIDC